MLAHLKGNENARIQWTKNCSDVFNQVQSQKLQPFDWEKKLYNLTIINSPQNVAGIGKSSSSSNNLGGISLKPFIPRQHERSIVTKGVQKEERRRKKKQTLSRTVAHYRKSWK